MVLRSGRFGIWEYGKKNSISPDEHGSGKKQLAIWQKMTRFRRKGSSVLYGSPWFWGDYREFADLGAIRNSAKIAIFYRAFARKGRYEAQLECFCIKIPEKVVFM